jgi:hypothetical protein
MAIKAHMCLLYEPQTTGLKPEKVCGRDRLLESQSLHDLCPRPFLAAILMLALT